jgi:membrane dipeptidase
LEFLDQYEERAYELHQKYPVVDAHLDLAAEVYARYQNGEREVIKNHYLDHLREAGITFLVSSVFVETKQLPARGLELTLCQISALMEDIETVKEEMVLVKSAYDMDRVIEKGKIGIILYMEGLDIITNDCNIVRALYAMGVRGASLTWSRRNYLGEGCCMASQLEDIRGGLSKLGLKTLKMLEELHMFVDVSHLNDDGFEDVIKYATKPFIATHSNARSVQMNYRNLTDRQIQLLAEQGGVMGLNAYKDIVGADPEGEPIRKMCAHVLHVIQLVGDKHVGYGLDLCDSYNLVSPRLEFSLERGDCLRNHSELRKVTAELLREGLPESSVIRVIGHNFIDYFMAVV